MKAEGTRFHAANTCTIDTGNGLPAARSSAEGFLSPLAFYRRLPELLKKHNLQWVAFHGEELIGVAATQTEMYQRCVGLGLAEDEFVVLFANAAALGDQDEIDLPVNP
jgi:hypothetical protein